MLKKFVGNLPTNCLSKFDHFLGLAFKGFRLVFVNLFRINLHISFSAFQYSIALLYSIAFLQVFQNFLLTVFQCNTNILRNKLSSFLILKAMTKWLRCQMFNSHIECSKPLVSCTQPTKAINLRIRENRGYLQWLSTLDAWISIYKHT